MRVELIARKGTEVFRGWLSDSKVASQVGRGWADRGYFVTIVCHPATVTS